MLAPLQVRVWMFESCSLLYGLLHSASMRRVAHLKGCGIGSAASRSRQFVAGSVLHRMDCFVS